MPIPRRGQKIPTRPAILTTTVGSYPVPDWLAALPSEQAIIDATRVVIDIQRQAGIDLPTDGELYRFDVNHPDTNGMIDYFVRPMAGLRGTLGRGEVEQFRAMDSMGFRARPAAVVVGPVGEGGLNLLSDCERAAATTDGPLKFTVTSPYMLARTLLDRHYGNFEALLLAVAQVLADQVAGLPCAAVQIDEANIPGNPDHGPMAARAMNLVLDRIDRGTRRGVHFCFGNYGGQTIQKGNWSRLIDFLNSLHCDHLVLELAHRPASDLDALRGVRSDMDIGVGVVDIKVNHVETPEDVARRIADAEKALGPDRVKWVHPDCGFWMLKRTIADRKIAALAAGRDLYLGLQVRRREDPEAGKRKKT